MDSYEKRIEVVQDVIDRHVKYGDSYVEALNKFNKQFPVEIEQHNNGRIYTKGDSKK